MKLVLLLILVCVFASGCGADDGNPEVRKTSSNTWTIYDPEGYPDHYINRTCQSDGKLVASLTAPGEAYDWIYVTCADHVEPTSTPTPEGFAP